MGRNFICMLLLSSVVSSGCATINKMAGHDQAKPKQNSAVADARSSATFVGSPDFTSSNKLKDPIKTRLAYAAWCEQAGNLQEAHASYQKVLEKSSKNSEAMLGLARVERSIGRESEADARLKKALKMHPQDTKVLIAIGQVHISRNQWPEAYEKMKAAYEIDPYDKVNEYHLAHVEAQMGNLGSAFNHFTRAVGQAEAYYNLAYILNEQGNTVEAEKNLINALKLKPDLQQAETMLASIRGGRRNNLKDVQTASFDQP